jgi:hypothetical protein
MTRYTVSWRPEIEADLAQMWSEATDKQRITAAADQIDKELSRDASDKGVEVHEGLLALIIEPLIVYFTVSQEDRLVTVWLVRRTRG